MENTLLKSLIKDRRSGLADWLDENAPYSSVDQLHLDVGTPEQAYWHLGYMAALDDILARLNDAAKTPGNAGTSSRFPPGAKDVPHSREG